jgi:hypothetical protein
MGMGVGGCSTQKIQNPNQQGPSALGGKVLGILDGSVGHVAPHASPLSC